MSPAIVPRPHAEPAAATRWNWVPIRSLSDRHRAAVLVHLLALAEGDRYLRFGYAANDAQIARYVDSIDFDHDELFGIFNRRLELIAMCHLAYPIVPGEPGARQAEFGVSVAHPARGRGFGHRLFERAVLHARNRGVQTLLIHALSENVAMLKIARQAGASVERDGSESEAWLRLPPDSIASHVEALMEEQVAEIDFQWKRHASQVHQFLEALAEVRTHIATAGRIADE